MDLLLTWSGTASHDIAEFFRTWILDVLPSVKPWFSPEDIAKGKKWFPELTAQLDKSHVSITYITPENVRSPWVFYEVGFIAAKLENGFVCPYLVGVDSKLVKDTPLGQFQWTLAEKEDTWKLIRSINQYLGDKGLAETILKGNFNTQWPKLKRQIDKVVEAVGEVEEQVTETEPSIEEQLSKEARYLLAEASNGNGLITYVKCLDGTLFKTNGKSVLTDQTPRTIAAWKGALDELANAGLVNPADERGWVFGLSKKGYAIADLIRSRS